MTANSTGPMIEIRRSRAEWTAMYESLLRCRNEITDEAMAYREKSTWREHDRVTAAIDTLRHALARAGEPLAIRLPREAWLRHLSAFREGANDVERSWVYGQAHPEWLAHFPDKLAYPSIRAAYDAFLETLPGNCRDTERVCERCERLLTLDRFARTTDGTKYLNMCLDCHQSLPRSTPAPSPCRGTNGPLGLSGQALNVGRLTG